MMCARRLAGARKPASSAGSPSRPDLHPGRGRARLSLLPVLALLLCGLHLLAAAPAAAQSVTAPSVPRNVTVTPGDGKLILTWQAPSSWGTWSANSFWIQWKEPGAPASRWSEVKAVGVTDGFTDTTSAVSIVFTGSQTLAGTQPTTVTNGTTYDLRIAAESKDPNAAGDQVTHYRYSAWVEVSGTPQAATSAPAAVTSLTATSGDRKLDLAWTPPSEEITNYEMHYTSSSTVGDNADALTGPVGGNAPTAANGWIDAGYNRSDRAPKHQIGLLTNGTQYRVRVRAVNSAGNGPWAFVRGTPQATTTPVAQWARSAVTVRETDADQHLTLDIILSKALTDAVVLSVSQTSGDATGSGTGKDWEKLSASACVTGSSGDTSLSCTIVVKGDNTSESDETIQLTLAVTSGTVSAGTRSVMTVTIENDDEAPVAPGVPEDVTVIRGDGQLGLLWQPPASWGTWPAASFEVQWKLSSANNTQWEYVKTAGSFAVVTPTGTSFIFTGPQTDVGSATYTVTNGTAYDLRIRAVTQETGTDGMQESHFRESSWVSVYGYTPSEHPHGDPPGKPTLTYVQTGTNAPTASTLSFTIPCVTPGNAPVTDYTLRAELQVWPYPVSTQHFTVPSPCRTITVTLTGLTASRPYGVRAFARNLVGRRSELSDSNAGTTTSGQGTIRPPGVITPDLAAYEALIGKIRDWRNDSRYVSDKRHTDRWDRVLLAFRQPVSDSSLTAMSAAEAQRYADRGWTRWVEVAAALREIESAHPVVTIAGGDPVTEGAAAGFTLTASRAPSAGLAVTVSVAQSGAFAQASALGTRTVTIPAGKTTAAFTVATVDDGADEADGGIVASVASGTGYTVGDAARATVTVADNDEGNPDIVTKRTIAREGTDEAAVFTVRLSRAASHAVSVDYATADATRYWAGSSPARSGADYTATSGTLTFAAGETSKTVSVPILDDAIDEGMEYFLLRFSNPRGAGLAAAHRERQGVIRNSDPLQAMWLARFGRMVASDAVASVTARLETPRDAGSHVTVAGQRMNFGEADGGEALATVLTGFAQTFGAPSAPAADKDDPFARHRLTSGWNDPATTTGARRVTARELLLGTSFRAVLGQGAGSQWTSWGQGASVSRFSAAVPGLGLTGEAATGSMGMDYERGRLLMGFAMTHSVGEGTASDAGWRYALGSTATMAMPYARLALSDRISVWGLAGTGSGRLSLDLDGSVPQSYRTDLSMTLAATGVRGDLIAPAEPGGFALALKADAFWVRTESDRVTASEFGSLMGARGESSRVRAMLDGSRTFSFASGAALTPKLELGVRHDAGDAETGTGLEVGAGLGFADPARGLDMALRVHGLAVHAEDGYDEWGVSGQLRLVPGGAGRGLSMSLTPSWGVDPAGSQRLWALPASSGLAANGDAEPSSRFDAEVGYGMALLGDRFTGTPNVGFGLSDTAREYRMGWRLTSAVRGDPGFEVSLDATRREPANDNGEADHGVMLRSLVRW